MNSPNLKLKLNAQIYEEACEWLVHFRAGDADDDVQSRQRLDEWLRRSPEHVRAYLEVSSIWEDVASHDAERKIDADTHVARALMERNVYPLELNRSDEEQRTRKQTPSVRYIQFGVAASVLLIGAWSVSEWLWQSTTYVTD